MNFRAILCMLVLSGEIWQIDGTNLHELMNFRAILRVLAVRYKNAHAIP